MVGSLPKGYLRGLGGMIAATVALDQAMNGHLPCRRGEKAHDFKPYVTGFQECKDCHAIERLPDFEPDWDIMQ